MIGLTPKQSQALSFIRSFTAEKGYAPSYQEIATNIDLRSLNSVHRLVHALQDRGAIKLLPNRARAISLDDDGQTAVKLPRDLFHALSRAAQEQDIAPQTALQEAVRAWLGEG